jgi:hypothetical protein
MDANVLRDLPEPDDREPRWPALIALLAVGGVYAALPASLSMGPRGLVPGILGALIVPLLITHRSGHHVLNQRLGITVNGFITFALILSLVLLVKALPAHKEEPTALLLSAAALWLANVLIFALWYWRLDAGGPNQRDLRACHLKGAFMFPQMTMDEEARRAADEHEWSPEFIDYLFLAFNTSTALSPTDAPVLARWAKALMMLQAIISLTVIVLLAGRAVNIL